MGFERGPWRWHARFWTKEFARRDNMRKPGLKSKAKKLTTRRAPLPRPAAYPVAPKARRSQVAPAPGRDARRPRLDQEPGGPGPHRKVKELVRLAREQGHLTYEDVNEALPMPSSPRKTWTRSTPNSDNLRLRSLIRLRWIAAGEARRPEGGNRSDSTSSTTPCGCTLRQSGQSPRC